MSVSPDLLYMLAKTLQIQMPGPQVLQPGQPVTASLVPPVADLHATDIVSGILDVTWLAKELRFDTTVLGLQPQPID